jgi:hypothetical protein
MKLRHRFALSLVLTAAIAACGGGGGGGGNNGNNGADNGGGIGAVTVPSCASSDTAQGWLTDYKNTSTLLAYDQPDQGCVKGTLTGSTLTFDNYTGSEAPVFLTRNNILAMIGATALASSTGTAPKFSFYIDPPANNQAAVDSTIDLAITLGTDSKLDANEIQVLITGLAVVTQLENNELVIRTKGVQSVSVNAYRNNYNTPIPIPLTFSNDLIAGTTTVLDGVTRRMAMTVEAFGLLTKINNDPNTSGLLKVLTDAGYPAVGDYTFSIQKTNLSNWPLKTTNGDPINTLSIGLPIN